MGEIVKKGLAVILSVVLLLGMSGCSEEFWDAIAEITEEQENAEVSMNSVTSNNDSETEFVNSRKSISLTLHNDMLQIQRQTRDSVTLMGEPGTWTIFVYLCGTDLESENGLATMDMGEMLEASTGKDVKFVIQTGGTSGWNNNVVSASKMQRFVISDGEMFLLDEKPLKNMGESAQLADFLYWGIDNYAASNMGLIFWNHGGGSISGVCFDEENRYDSLSLREIDMALLSVFDSMTDKFEFIGFDACLMGTIECANILATYANYMYGSEELEPGYGWDYKAIGDFLGKNQNADGAALGKVVADSFYQTCANIGEGDLATLSVIDLSKIDQVMISFNNYARNLYNATEDQEIFSKVVRNAVNVDNYGGNNKSEGYTNMVDLAGIVHAGASYAEGSEVVLSALNEAVIYSRNGSYHQNACGLATYYPLKIQGSKELSTFGEIAISPYYLAFVDRAAYGAVNYGNVDDYNSSGAFSLWGVLEYLFSPDEELYYEDDEDYWDYYEGYEITGESPLIDFVYGPQLDEDGRYGFVLSEEALNNATSVQANVYVISDDGEDIIEYGISTDIYMDWEKGEFYDSFDGFWFSLPDGQNLAVYIVTEGDGYDIYTSPITLNGVETNLRITHDYINGAIKIDGAWEGIDENGMAAKEVVRLKAGDEIIPQYYAFAIYSDDEYMYEGVPYIFDGEPEIYYNYLPDGEYLYGFFIDDLYGDFYTTDYVIFTVEGEDIYFEE